MYKFYQKRQKQTFLTVHGQCEAFFINKLNLSRDQKLSKHQIWPNIRRFNILGHEVYRYTDENSTKIVKIGKFSTFCLFRCQFRTIVV